MIVVLIVIYLLIKKYKHLNVLYPIVSLFTINLTYFLGIDVHEMVNIDLGSLLIITLINIYSMSKAIFKPNEDQKLCIGTHILFLVSTPVWFSFCLLWLISKTERYNLNKILGVVYFVLVILKEFYFA